MVFKNHLNTIQIKEIMRATKEQIADWKKKHGFVCEISVGDKSCFLRKPTRHELSYGTTVAAKDPIKFNEILLKACWLAGDEDIQTNDELFLAVCPKLAELVEVKEAQLKKL